MPVPTNDSQDAARPAAVECNGVWKFFGNPPPAALDAARSGRYGKDEFLQEFGAIVGVADASFAVQEGETFCLMGLSGSGKSTLLRLLNRLIEPTMGKITIKGRDVGTLGAAELRELRARHIGMAFQHVALLPYRTVVQNVALSLEVQGIPKDKRRDTCMAVLETVGLGNWADRFPHELSGGMQQRVGIARALVADPQILLMDEPFSALDPLIRKQLQTEFRQLTHRLGKTSVFVTHDLDEAIRIGDRIAIMKDGRIVQIGTPEDIVLNPADAYVAEFTEGISRLPLIKARSIMRAPAPGLDAGALPRVGADTTLEAIIDQALHEAVETIAVHEAGRVLGTLNRDDILHAVRGTGAGGNAGRPAGGGA